MKKESLWRGSRTRKIIKSKEKISIKVNEREEEKIEAIKRWAKIKEEYIN